MQIVKNINEKRLHLHKLVVLLAEEHQLTAKIQKKGLEDGGFLVYLAKTHAELLKQIKSQKIDLLMVDSHFCQNDMQKHAQKIRQNSLNPQIKIVLTSVASSFENVKRKISDKVDLFMEKPILKEKMIRELKKICSRQARNTDRIILDLTATIYIQNKILSGKIIDISNSGVHLEDKDKKLKQMIDSALKIDIELPNYKHPVTLTGIVVRKTLEGYGLKILKISLKNKEKIRRFIEKNGYGKHLETYYL